MFDIIIIITALAFMVFVTFSIFDYIVNTDTKKQGGVRGITLILISAMLLTLSIISDINLKKVNKDVELETVGITEIYRQEDNKYIITTEDNKIYTIETDAVYRGDSNYIVKKHYPNVAKLSKFWFEFDEYKYSIVVTDTNIQTLPNLTN